MAKNFRGKLLRTMPNHGRGECPVCHRGGVKLLREVKVNDATVKSTAKFAARCSR